MISIVKINIAAVNRVGGEGSLDALPQLPLGTRIVAGSSLALPLAGTGGHPAESVASADNVIEGSRACVGLERLGVSRDADKRKEPLTILVNGPVEYARQDLNLQPLAPEASALSN